MKQNTNVFILTTEYHFLLSMNIIFERFNTAEFTNQLIFTGPRLSDINVGSLPAHVYVTEINVESERHLEKKIRETILVKSLAHVFVFTAYRDLETFVLCSVDPSVKRHLVQDGANFYFKISKSVMWSRFKETLKIYRNLWRKGILLKKFVRYKKHLADCGFIDDVWITHPEVYEKPLLSAKAVIKVNLLEKNVDKTPFYKYFGMDEDSEYSNAVIFLSSRLNHEKDILAEINIIQSIIMKFTNYALLVKLHPAASVLQVEMLRSAFENGVIKNFTPAELYISKAKNSFVVGCASAALYYHNKECRYFSLVRDYRYRKLFPETTHVNFPAHITVVKNLMEL